jgi:hypothetical protein
MSGWFALMLFICPTGGVVDRIEEKLVVVLGASGVRVVARGSFAPRGPVHEGDRVVLGSDGSCTVRPPSPAERDRVRDRLRALTRP